jgi:superoxide dismutase, Cu-Zn family
MRIAPLGVAAAAVALAAVGCGETPDDPEETPTDEAPAEEPDADPAGTDGEELMFSVEFQPYDDEVQGVTYDEEAVPVDSWATVGVSAAEESTAFTLDVNGLEAERDFGAHLHTDPCGPDPEDSGPHYQNEPDPEQPSTDPAYANPENEVWLDFTTDSAGTATAETEVAWTVREGEANSVVLHEEHTDEHGQAGDRLACIDLPL